MFTSHGLYKSQVVSWIYGLLIGKKTSDYDQFSNRIMDTDDFESATTKSVNSLFPNVLHEGNVTIWRIINIIRFPLLLGCLFHFGQCVWLPVQGLRLQKKYQEDKPFSCQVRKLITLALVPIWDVIKAFDLVADALLDYFEKTCIGEPKKRGKSINRKINQSSTSPSRNWPKETTVSNRALECLWSGKYKSS